MQGAPWCPAMNFRRSQTSGTLSYSPDFNRVTLRFRRRIASRSNR
ncbi:MULTISPECIES: hypothetical protein [unclassified Sulfitobacter]